MNNKNKLIISIEYRFYHHEADNSFWTDSAFPCSFWQRYLVVFKEVVIIARAEPVSKVQDNWQRVDSERVSISLLPYYLGPLGFLKKLPATLNALGKLIDKDAAYIVRAPSILGSLLIRRLRHAKLPYSLEVVGDPKDAFAANVIQHPFRPVFRWLFTYELKWQCANANGVAYVTRAQLQQRYPCKSNAFTAAYSSIELPAKMICHQPRQPRLNTSLKFLFIGSLAQPYKGLHIILQALHICHEQGLQFSLDVLGDGKYRAKMERLMASLGLSEQVTFHGVIPRETGVIPLLDQADVFINASLTEGLPRVVIEAMARGLPCVATEVGGIPELISKQGLVPPNDVEALADKICEFASQPEKRREQSEQNLRKAAEYEESVLFRRRSQFYQEVANC